MTTLELSSGSHASSKQSTNVQSSTEVFPWPFTSFVPIVEGDAHVESGAAEFLKPICSTSLSPERNVQFHSTPPLPANSTDRRMPEFPSNVQSWISAGVPNSRRIADPEDCCPVLKAMLLTVTANGVGLLTWTMLLRPH